MVAQREEWAPRCLQARGFIWSDGLIVGGHLLRDSQRCGQSPHWVYKTVTQAAAQAVHSAQTRFAHALVGTESLAGCLGMRMRKT